MGFHLEEKSRREIGISKRDTNLEAWPRLRVWPDPEKQNVKVMVLVAMMSSLLTNLKFLHKSLSISKKKISHNLSRSLSLQDKKRSKSC